jgi:TetR/AcrR family transcriptional regulator, mexCD-oprJ operon repressor
MASQSPNPSPSDGEPAPPPLRARVAATILEAAARTLAGRGEQASMSDVATAAGVGRATVYRYFPTREVLLEQLAAFAVEEAASRLEASRVDEVAPLEGISRAVRALVEVGDPFVVVAREQVRLRSPVFNARLVDPLTALVERGQTAGVIRDGLPASWLTESLLALVVGGLASGQPMGKEDTIAAITELFMDGARGRVRGT